MSFQHGQVRWQGIYGRRLEKQGPYMTASTAIDPKPLPTSLRRDDIPVEACFSLSKRKPPMSFLLGRV